MLALVNLDPEHEVSVQTGLKGTASGQMLTALKMDAHNDFGAAPLVRPAPYKAYADQGIVLKLPAKSVVVVTVQ